MDRYAFDNVLLPINPADPARLPFITTVIPLARKQGMGVVGMKVLAAGAPRERGRGDRRGMHSLRDGSRRTR